MTPPTSGSALAADILANPIPRTETLPRFETIHAGFEAQARRRPHDVAVQCAGRHLSYAELNARSNALAQRLVRAGVGPEVLVAVFVDRSPDMVVAILGILKAGGAYLPLDPGNPPERTRFILDDARPRLVVADAALRERLPSSIEIVCLDELHADGHASRPDPAVRVAGENLAYVIYTSGSTGQPKGTLVTHGNVVRLFQTTDAWFGFGPRDVWTVFHSFAFDFSVWELWGALFFGGRAVIVPGAVARSPGDFLALLRAEHVTVLCQTPSAFYPLIDADRAAAHPSLALRFVIFGGEALDFRRLKPWCERRPGVPALVNMYGITETTVHTTFHVVAPDALGSASVIGHPLPDLDVHLLDDAGLPVADGEIGEMYIGGPGVARGYLNRPELTAARFIPDQFRGDGSRLYRSGDRGRLRPDGLLEFCGRIDGQVKLRGYRIELGEIEAALDGCAGVAQSAVVLRSEPAAEPELVAYVIARTPAPPSPRELRAALGEKLPDYMIPAAFVALPALPLTQNGKLDRDALPPPGRRHRVERAAAPARSGTEAQVAAIWTECFAGDPVGVDDDFIELGGHSLLAARIATRLLAAFDVPVAPVDVLRSRTVEALACAIDAMREGAVRADLPLCPRGGAAVLPTSCAQDTVLYFHELAPGNLAYNNQVTLRLRGWLDVAALERALAEIVRRHEALRTTYARVDGAWRQVIHPPWPVTLPVVDATPAELPSYFAHRFDPGELPLVRWTLIRHGPGDHVLVHLEHHLVHDGWSFGVFMKELVALYGAYADGKPSPLPDLDVQFADFALWQRSRLQGHPLGTLSEFWKSKLAGPLPVLSLPTDRARPALQTFRGAEVQVVVPPALAGALRAFARSAGCSLFSVMLAGFAALLRRYTGDDDLIVGSGFANRERREAEPLIGMIVNLLPLRLDLAGDPDFLALANRVQAVTHEAMAHQALPFDHIVRLVDLPRDPSRNPLCQVAFSFHDAPIPRAVWPGLDCEVAYPHNGSAKFDMNVIVIPEAEQQTGLPGALRDERITIKWDCNTDLFDVDSVRRMLDGYLRVLAAGCADPRARTSDLLQIDAGERALLAAWNDTTRAYPDDRCIHALFAEQARCTPSAKALVVAGGVTVTYLELDERANRLAHYLRRRGVGPEAIVGLCVERSAAMVVAILGILKAGAAYLPLDVDYPSPRLEFMLRDTRAPVLLTQSNLRDRLPSFAGQIVCIDTEADAIGQEPCTDALAAASARSLAYVMYTSGSTGMPKGVCVEHRSVVRLVRNTDYVSVRPDDVLLQLAPISFDASTFELWGSLLNGARLVLPPAGAMSLRAIADTLRAHRVSTLWLTAALFNQMVDHELDALRGVRHLLAGGEALSIAHVRRMLDALAPEGRLINGYGPTENTTFTCCHPMAASTRIARSVPIGRPITNTQAWILDERQRPVPPGVPGEVCIAGDGLARGYLNQPELTAERFVIVDGVRMYRSGDRARHLADGTLEFMGRGDAQLKINGFRIEPAEIEAALERHPSVRDCVVAAKAGPAGDRRLVAYVVAHDGASADPVALRHYLRGELPAFMVPTDYVALAALPVTAVGKVDRDALPPLPAMARSRDADVDADDGADADADASPPTAAEAVITEIWARHLGHSNFGRDDDFFDVGGSSLAAAGIFAEIAERFAVSPPLASFFQRPTVAGLAANIAHVPVNGGADILIPVQPAGSKPPIFAMLGVGGNFNAYARIAKGLGADRPFYSLEMPGLDNTRHALDRIEEVADECARAMDDAGPWQSCVLLGACAGSLVMFELAHRLSLAGRTVDMVVMVDPPPTGEKRSRRLSSYELWRRLALPRFVASRVRMYVRESLALQGPERSAYLKEKLALACSIVAQRGPLRAGAQEIQQLRVRETTSAALQRYVPRTYDGHVALLLGDRYTNEGTRELSAEWRNVCAGRFDIATAPGKDSGAMLSPPNVHVLIDRLNALLERG